MGKMKKTSEVTGPIVIGRFYLVPHAVFKNSYSEHEEPIMLPLHNDKDLFPNPTHGAHHDHYHVDKRFDKDHYDLIRRNSKGEMIEYKVNRGNFVRFDYVDRIEWRKRKAIRNFDNFEKDRYVEFHQKLQDKGVKDGYCLKANKVCPHRGANLASIPPDKNGHIECPMHGLKFDAETGEMIVETLKECST
jgi:nitrite reductase/ring-hydroxylating ferredoxin subunit